MISKRLAFKPSWILHCVCCTLKIHEAHLPAADLYTRKNFPNALSGTPDFSPGFCNGGTFGNALGIVLSSESAFTEDISNFDGL